MTPDWMLFADFEIQAGPKIREWIESVDSRGSRALCFYETREPVTTRMFRPICRLLNVNHGGLAVICESGDRIVAELDLDAAIVAVVEAARSSGAEEVVVLPQRIPLLGEQTHDAFMTHAKRATAVLFA